MRSTPRALVLAAVLVSGAIVGCRRAVVIVPQRDRGYTQTDTLYGTYKDKRVRVTFRHDTTWRVDTVLKRDTLWRAGSRVDTVLFTRVDTLVRRDSSRFFPMRRDTIRIGQRDTVRITRVDTVRVGAGARDTVRITRVDTLRLTVRDTLRLSRVDTLRLFARDTIWLTRVDTLRLVTRDTVRLAAPRMLFVPPGHYPPEGECRVWIVGLAPGRQARAAPCSELGAIPAEAFVLFGGVAWDFDYDWVSAGRRGGVPAEIVALKHR